MSGDRFTATPAASVDVGSSRKHFDAWLQVQQSNIFLLNAIKHRHLNQCFGFTVYVYVISISLQRFDESTFHLVTQGNIKKMPWILNLVALWH